MSVRCVEQTRRKNTPSPHGRDGIVLARGLKKHTQDFDSTEMVKTASFMLEGATLVHEMRRVKEMGGIH